MSGKEGLIVIDFTTLQAMVLCCQYASVEAKNKFLLVLR
jgi:hypothetical protein